MNRSSQELTYRQPGCYSRVINRRSSIVCAEAYFGKAQLMQEGHTEVRRQGLSVKLLLKPAQYEEDIFRQIRLALGEQIWSEIEAQPACLHRFIGSDFLTACVKFVIHDWMTSENDDVHQQLLNLGAQHPAHNSVIRKLLNAPLIGAPARNVKSLIQAFQTCVLALSGSREAHAYLWLRAADAFDWQIHAPTMRALVNGMGRGRGNVHVKMFVTPADLRQLDPNSRDPAIDGEVERIELAWGRRLLEEIADAVCQAQAGTTFGQLVDARRLAVYLADHACVVPPAPGAWIVLAERASALSRQHQCAVLDDELWREALTQYCRAHRRLRIAGNKVFAFGEEIKIDRIGVEILQIIHAWQNDPQKRDAHPQAQQIAEEINKRRPKHNRRLADGDSVHANISRLRSIIDLEPVYHFYKKAPAAIKKSHLIHIKGDQEGYFLENVDR